MSFPTMLYSSCRLWRLLNSMSAAVCGEHSSTINCRPKQQDHIKHVLRDRLHWLPVPQRVQFELCLLTYKALHGLAPSYIADLCRPVHKSQPSDPLLVATSLSPPLSRTFGTRAFAVAGPIRPGINCRCTMHIRARESVGSFKTTQKSHFHFVD